MCDKAAECGEQVAEKTPTRCGGMDRDTTGALYQLCVRRPKHSDVPCLARPVDPPPAVLHALRVYTIPLCDVHRVRHRFRLPPQGPPESDLKLHGHPARHNM